MFKGLQNYGYASGRFQSQAEIRRFLEAQPDYPKDSKGRVAQQRVTDMLDCILYAGVIDYPNWGISNVRGLHQPLITLETYEKIQERRRGVAKAPAGKNINQDFPLRGFVCCSDCGKPYTSCWSKGKNKHYPYYLCDTRGCPSYRKSLRKEVIEGEFETIVKTLLPSRKLIELVSAMFRKAWDQTRSKSQTASPSPQTRFTHGREGFGWLYRPCSGNNTSDGHHRSGR